MDEDRPTEVALPIWHDLHTHTTYSDGGHSLALSVFMARANELDAIAFTDHYNAHSKLALSDDVFAEYLSEIERERSVIDDMIVLKGAEAVALNTRGGLSLPPDKAEKLEWVLCDLGGVSEGTLRNTPTDKRQYMDNVLSTYLGLCDVSYVNVIAHPFNTGNTTPCAMPADYPESGLRELAAKMADKDKVFDVMAQQLFWFQKSCVAPAEITAQYVEVVKLFASAGVRFQVSSDDHRTGTGHTLWSRRVLARAGVSANQIVDAAQIPLKSLS